MHLAKDDCISSTANEVQPSICCHIATAVATLGKPEKEDRMNEHRVNMHYY
jgi:hypothetical protein